MDFLKSFDGKDLKSSGYYHKSSALLSGTWLFYEQAVLSPILLPWKVIMYLWGRLIFALCGHPINNNPNICTYGIFCDIIELTDCDYSGVALCTELPLVSKWVWSSEALQSKTCDIYVYEIGETLSFTVSIVTKPEYLMRGICWYLQYNHNVHNKGVLASSKWAKENKGRLARGDAGKEGALADQGGGSPGLVGLAWLGDHWNYWQHWHEDPWAGRYQRYGEEKWALGELGATCWLGTAGLLCGGQWRSQRRSKQSPYAICCCTINCY